MGDVQTLDISELQSIVARDPGASEFVALAEELAKDPSRRAEAREVCFRGLTQDPRNTRGRLTLARLFYLDSMGEFCVRELVRLRQLAPLHSLDKLLDSFGEFAKPFLQITLEPVPNDSPEIDDTAEESSPAVSATSEPQMEGEEDTVAEIDLEADFMEALEQLESD